MTSRDYGEYDDDDGAMVEITTTTGPDSSVRPQGCPSLPSYFHSHYSVVRPNDDDDDNRQQASKQASEQASCPYRYNMLRNKRVCVCGAPRGEYQLLEICYPHSRSMLLSAATDTIKKEKMAIEKK
ncbi:hypothetical protein V1478_002597 [Vespula squamosa]|uniref:Uncharacterized protein n=1 Tax=Vespula squamosa TaxID=30214 RepID=A0ABD2BT06_VESSQ